MHAGPVAEDDPDRITTDRLLRPLETALLIASLVLAIAGTVLAIFHSREPGRRSFAQEEGSLVAPGSDARFFDSSGAPGVPAPVAASPAGPGRAAGPESPRPMPSPGGPGNQPPSPPSLEDLLHEVPIPPPPSIPPLPERAAARPRR
jgi:hypothetical protein